MSRKPGGQEENCPQELEDTFDRHAHEPERQEQQPDEGVENERQDGQGPADDEQDAPKQE